MRGRTVLALLVVVAGLAAFIAFYERDLPSSEERQAQAKKVLGIDAEAVHGLSIESTATAVRLRRGESGGWRLLEPLEAAADDGAVDQLVEALVGLGKQRTLTGVDATTVGLDPPRLRVVVELEEGSRQLDLGSSVPGSKSLVASIADDPQVYVVSDSILADLEKEPDLWRDRVVFHGDREAVARWVVAGNGERRVVVRRGAEFWLEEPVADRADDDRVNELLSDLEGLRVGTFIASPASGTDEDAAVRGMGLDLPEWIVEVSTAGDERPFRLEVGAPVGDLPDRRFGRVGEQFFEADSQLFAHLARPLAEWLSRRWTDLPAYRIDGVGFSGRFLQDAAAAHQVEAHRVEWSRDGGEWRRGAERVDSSLVDTLLDAVTGAEAEAVMAGPEAAALRARLGEPGWTLSLRSSAAATATDLTAWPPLPDGRFPVGVTGRDSLLLLLPAVAGEIDRGVQAAVAAAPVAGLADAIEGGDG